MTTVSKNAQIIKFFTQLADNGIGRTKLFKLAYLADLEARKLMGRPISSFDYQWHNHGPFDRNVYEAIEELENSGLAETRPLHHGSGHVEKRLVDVKAQAALLGFSPAENEILQYVAARYMAVPLQELLDDIVYQSKPMKAVEKRGDHLDMAIVDKAEERRVGFVFEDVVAADLASREEGGYMLADEFFDGLRAETFGNGAATA